MIKVATDAQKISLRVSRWPMVLPKTPDPEEKGRKLATFLITVRHVEVPNIIHEARRSTRPGVIFHAVGPLLYNRLLAPSTPAHIYKLSTTKGNHVRCFRAVRVRHLTAACADCFDQTCQGWQLRHLLDVQRPACRGTRSPECPRRARRGCGALSFSL